MLRDALGCCYHVLNRGNRRRLVSAKKATMTRSCPCFAKPELRYRAGPTIDVRLLAFCLMPNHFHLLLWPRNNGDLSRSMMWLMRAHVRRYSSPFLPRLEQPSVILLDPLQRQAVEEVSIAHPGGQGV